MNHQALSPNVIVAHPQFRINNFMVCQKFASDQFKPRSGTVSLIDYPLKSFPHVFRLKRRLLNRIAFLKCLNAKIFTFGIRAVISVAIDNVRIKFLGKGIHLFQRIFNKHVVGVHKNYVFAAGQRKPHISRNGCRARIFFRVIKS